MNDSTALLITGGTGLLGTALTHHFTAMGRSVILLARNVEKARQNGRFANNALVAYAHWDVEKGVFDPAALEGVTALIHLAGAGVVDKPWTEDYKKEIVESRVHSSALLVKALAEIPNTVETVISASGIGWYGPDKVGPAMSDEVLSVGVLTDRNDSKQSGALSAGGDTGRNPPETETKDALSNDALSVGVPTDRNLPGFVETDPPTRKFLGETCRLWEESIRPVTNLNKRLVIIRTGIVLTTEGGALAEFLKPLALRMATVLGSGKQVISWIHIEDYCRLVAYALENKAMAGPYNAVAPQPVTNRKLVQTLGKNLYGNGFLSLPVPAFVLKLMMGDRSIEVLNSATVSAAKILETGFAFAFPTIEGAVDNLVG